MRILHVAWEYPPLVYGGLGRHVGAIARAQARLGHDVTVVTQAESEPSDGRVDGVRVIRVPRDLGELEFNEANLLGWVGGLESALSRAVATLSHGWQPDVIHAHDWMVAHVAVTARTLFQTPIVTTFHATEAGRHQGWLGSDLSRTIHGIEWWLARQSCRLITCSSHMRWEANRLFGVSEDSIFVVPNGIDLAEWVTTPGDTAAARLRYAPSGRLIVYSGRLEWEKGIHTLLEAMPALTDRFRGLHLVIAGKGSKEEDLRAEARIQRLGTSVTFAGWLPEPELHALVAAADVSVVPSLYEPFGLVALEATALGTAVVVASSGGLAEFADEGELALTFRPGDAASLADAITRALADPDETARRLERAAQALVTVYNWERIAELTTLAYESAIDSCDKERLASLASESLVLPAGNLLSPAASGD